MSNQKFSFHLSVLFGPSETLYIIRFLISKLGHFRSNYRYNRKPAKKRPSVNILLFPFSLLPDFAQTVQYPSNPNNPKQIPAHITHKEFSFHLSLLGRYETLWFLGDAGTTVFERFALVIQI